MEGLRKPLQGVRNIVRFNWHFYALAAAGVVALAVLVFFLPENFRFLAGAGSLLILTPVALSLLVSLYVYDLSGLYELAWLDALGSEEHGKFANIHAGFDETSLLLRKKFPGVELLVFDFYDPEKHTEVSVKRARRAYPAFPGTREVSTSRLPLHNNSVDVIFLVFAAHEIRDEKERIAFFRELRRTLRDDGKIVVTEHLRDLPNFLAYTIGFFHFMPRSSWLRTFGQVGLKISGQEKVTPFVTTFILEKDGAES
jgi:hypothetical protein